MAEALSEGIPTSPVEITTMTKFALNGFDGQFPVWIIADIHVNPQSDSMVVQRAISVRSSSGQAIAVFTSFELADAFAANATDTIDFTGYKLVEVEEPGFLISVLQILSIRLKHIVFDPLFGETNARPGINISAALEGFRAALETSRAPVSSLKSSKESPGKPWWRLW